LLKLELNQIRANSWNANFMDAQEREALKQCMHKAGPEKTLPIVVRKMFDEGYEIVDGEHRWTIAKELGWEKISVVVREADDLQARAFCVSYNKLRGRFNWFKLYDVLKNDLDNGVNLEEAYKDALSSKELKWILSLSDLVPKARITLESSLKKYPEYTLEQLHLMSKFPKDQQESLSETYQKPIATHLLTRLLAAFLQKKPTPTHQKRRTTLPI
jgi:ParB/RepB/Spo0J family partition protein